MQLHKVVCDLVPQLENVLWTLQHVQINSFDSFTVIYFLLTMTFSHLRVYFYLAYNGRCDSCSWLTFISLIRKQVF